jgi:hypothetical protein
MEGMDERRRRVGRNEALFRQVNEELEALEQVTRITDETLGIVCECGDLLCTERVEVPVSKYEEVRGRGELFIVVPGHEISDTETVVEGTAGYNVVRKHEDGPAELARETDPRAG